MTAARRAAPLSCSTHVANSATERPNRGTLSRKGGSIEVRIITVEREYGSGGAQIAQELAQRLGWKIWDKELTAEIARKANVETRVAQRCDERVDTLLYRLFKVYARGKLRESASARGTRRVRHRPDVRDPPYGY